MCKIILLEAFRDWLLSLGDREAKGRIAIRIREAGEGYFGDHKYVAGGVRELRVHAGPGYRVYYGHKGGKVYILLCGGDKTSQSRDIKKAILLWKRIKGKKLDQMQTF